MIFLQNFKTNLNIFWFQMSHASKDTVKVKSNIDSQPNYDQKEQSSRFNRQRRRHKSPIHKSNPDEIELNRKSKSKSKIGNNESRKENNHKQIVDNKETNDFKGLITESNESRVSSLNLLSFF